MVEIYREKDRSYINHRTIKGWTRDCLYGSKPQAEMEKEMNIAVNTKYSAPQVTGADNSTTIYKASTESVKVRNSGYSLDIADKVMDDKAYQGQGMTAEDIMQQAQDTNVQIQKDFMLVMSNSVSGEDLQKMQEEGFDPGSTDVETYVSIVDQIKVTLAKAGIEIAGYNDNLDKETVEEITGNTIDANAILKKFQEADIPVTEENMKAFLQAQKEASEITKLAEDALKYMIVNQKTPTIENLYKAQFSSAASIKQGQGYYAQSVGNYATSYYAKKADSIHWDNIQSSLDAVISQAGMDVNQENRENAKWLVEAGIELNEQNLTKLSELKSIELPISQEKLLDNAVRAMQNGKSPREADVTGEASYLEEAEKKIQEVNSISEEAIHQTVESGQPINLKNLLASQREIDAENQVKGETKGDSLQKDNNSNIQSATGVENFGTQNSVQQVVEDESTLKEVTAKRQLEEIRLMMTIEANKQLIKSGYQIDTAELSKLVEALKETENAIRQTLFQGNTPKENEARAAIYQETVNNTRQLANMPVDIIGKAALQRDQVTLSSLHKEGSILQAQYTRAGESYEALMTAPRADLGDKISKAFQNVDDILADMNMEANDTNRRAVRILGYNSMEITTENIEKVKEADSLVSHVVEKMTPATTLQMIREQKNPLEMTMQDLEEYLQQENHSIKDVEKYSSYLQKLNHKNEISQEEKEAYIGIYRMFRQIEKTDGAVIGSLIATGADINFKNMLSAVRTRADKNIDVRIDQEYGSLEKLLNNNTAIDQQIMTGYQEKKNDNLQDQNENPATEKENGAVKSKGRYYARLSEHITDELSEHTTVEQLQKIDLKQETTIEEFAQEISGQDKEKPESVQEFRQNVKRAQAVEETVLQALIDYDQSVSIDNIEAATQLMLERGSLFRQVFSKGQDSNEKEGQTDAVVDNTEENKEAPVSKIEQLSHKMIEALSDKKQANNTYQEVIAQATKAVEDMVYQGASSMLDIRAAKTLYKGLSLAGNLAREENYEIPVKIKDEITSVNVKIYHNRAQKGKVSITMDTQALGKVVADLSVAEDKVTGMVAYENKGVKEDMQELMTDFEIEFAKAQQEAGLRKTIGVSLAQVSQLDINQFGEDREVPEDGVKLPTAELYQVAKAFMTAMKSVT